ncbi:hypothetical protein ACIQMR_37905 [Streptomyces sp. NPDC091376]|uniref:hypothetical protein n=1 Tax=Streptomyces sp. NPDC091376 TaxID=3365994 RepID=UPI00380EB38B
MPRKQLNDLTDTLIPALEEHREQVRHAARGGPRRVAPGTGRKHSLQELLGQLFTTTAMTISRAVKDVRPLLEANRVSLPASTARFRTPDDVARFLDPDETKIKPNVLIPGKPLGEASADVYEWPFTGLKAGPLPRRPAGAGIRGSICPGQPTE